MEELRSVPANSQKIIEEASKKKETLEKQKEKEEEKLKEVMDSLKIETQGLQEEKEVWNVLFCSTYVFLPIFCVPKNKCLNDFMHFYIAKDIIEIIKKKMYAPKVKV